MSLNNLQSPTTLSETSESAVPMSSLFLGLPAPLRQAGRRHRPPPTRAAALVLPSVRRLRAAPPCRTAVHPHISPAPLSLGLRRRHGRAAAMANPVTMFYTLSAVGRRRRRRNGVYASLFGVGAPEALVIGVVALLVFGPKGLAEVARNLGKTLRAFQPTIRELQDVSREFRSTLEREIGLDEDPSSSNYRPTTTNSSQQPAVDPNSKPEAVPYTSEELMKVTEEQLAASASAAWNTQQSPTSQKQEIASSSQSNDTALSGGSDGPGVATSEPNSNPSEKTQPRDEA